MQVSIEGGVDPMPMLGLSIGRRHSMDYTFVQTWEKEYLSILRSVIWLGCTGDFTIGLSLFLSISSS